MPQGCFWCNWKRVQQAVSRPSGGQLDSRFWFVPVTDAAVTENIHSHVALSYCFQTANRWSDPGFRAKIQLRFQNSEWDFKISSEISREISSAMLNELLLGVRIEVNQNRWIRWFIRLQAAFQVNRLRGKPINHEEWDFKIPRFHEISRTYTHCKRQMVGVDRITQPSDNQLDATPLRPLAVESHKSENSREFLAFQGISISGSGIPIIPPMAGVRTIWCWHAQALWKRCSVERKGFLWYDDFAWDTWRICFRKDVIRNECGR